MLSRYKQLGFSILEVIVALAISAIIAAAILTLFSQTLTSSAHVVQTGKLDGELNSLMDLIVHDIQRAGYWANAQTSNTNPFTSGTDDITVNGAGNCVTFTYDRNNDGVVAAIASGTDDEHYGFRLSGNVIQYRPPGAAFDCATASGNWQNVTDSNVLTITAFTVTKTNVAVDIDGTDAGTDTTNFRTITLTITGYLTNDSSVTKTITRTIKVDNNKYVP